MENNPTHKAKTLDGTWIEGWYDGSIESNPIIWCKHRRGCYHFEINPTTLCRSTYRPYSNGKIMYEGDEVEVDGRLFIIEWHTESCGFILCTNDSYRIPFMTHMKYWTLTGKNKHD